MTAKAQTVKVPIELVQKVDDEAEAFVDAPLFQVSDDREIAHVVVLRTDPDDGYLGKMPPTVTEGDLKKRWGGGKYQLQARSERNKTIKGGFRTIDISGDPQFESKAAQAKWKRQQGLDDVAAPTSEGIGIKEIFALLSSTESKQKAEAERRSAELEAQHKRELERIRVEGEIRARERQADDERRERMAEEREERRRKEDDSREDRRRKDEAEREERRRKDEDAARTRDREFQLQISALGRKGNADGSDMLLKGIQLARELAPGGDDDNPIAAVAKALLPRVVDGFAPKPAPPTAPAAPAATKDAVTLDGEIGKKAQQVIDHLTSLGIDPERGIDHALTGLLKMGRPTVVPSTPTPPAAISPAPPAKTPEPPNGTTRVKPRTTKK